jgi:SAM-dependent methyltransferase
MTQTNDYQRYFIVGDRHVGDYETMYRRCADPWRIEELGLRLDMRATLLLLEHSPTRVSTALDAGAGAGLFTLELLRLLRRTDPDVRLVVSDVAPTALELSRAKIAEARLDANVEFVPFDLRGLDLKGVPFEPASFDLIVLAQVLWGLLENLRAVFPGLGRLTRPGGRLLVSQHFPQPGRQGYGAELVSGPEDLSDLIAESGWRFENSLETDRRNNHHWASLWTWN